MRTSLLLAVAVAASAAGAAELPQDNGVYVVDADNAKQAIDELDTFILEFYAPWCGHCKRLAPEYEAAAKKLEGGPYKLAKVDATEEKNKDLATEHGVRGYPTLVYYKGGKHEKYTGGRTSKDIIKWLHKNGGADIPAKEVPVFKKKVEAIDFMDAAKKSPNDGVDSIINVLGLFADPASEAAKTFAKFAADHEFDAGFATANEQVFFDRFNPGEQHKDVVVLFSPFGDGGLVDVRTEDFTAEKLEWFLQRNLLPRLAPATQPFYDAINAEVSKRGRLVAFKSKLTDEERSVLQDMCSRYVHKFSCLAVEKDTGDKAVKGRLTKKFGATDEEEVLKIRYEKQQPEGSWAKFKPDSDPIALTREAMEPWITASSKVGAQGYILSEPVPADYYAENVAVLVGDNFDEVARDPKKHVLVEFYAPWCGHCKKLAPVYEELGAAFPKGNDQDIVIAKMDATANEANGVEVRGFPTIKLFPKGEGSRPVDFRGGERELEDFKKFLETHTNAENKKSEEKQKKKKSEEKKDEL